MFLECFPPPVGEIFSVFKGQGSAERPDCCVIEVALVLHIAEIVEWIHQNLTTPKKEEMKKSLEVKERIWILSPSPEYLDFQDQLDNLKRVIIVGSVAVR